MIKNTVFVIQVILFFGGIVVMTASGANGQFESMNFGTYFGMGMVILSLILHLVISFIEHLMDKK